MGLWKRRRAAIEERETAFEIAYPERVVTREYYAAVLGIRFDDDLSAAQHYLADGWRTGVVPHPFLVRPMVRSSMDAAVALRDQLREFARSDGAHPRLGPVGGVVEVKAARDAGRADLIDDGADFLLASPADRDGIPVRGGMRWKQFRQLLGESPDVSSRIHDAGMLDLDHYSTSRPLLGWHAALDEYLVEGEHDGRTPNWAFEPEWYTAGDRGQTRGSRPFNQLFHYVAGGERGSTTPADRSGRSLAALLALGAQDIVHPVGGGEIEVSAVRDALDAARVRRIPARNARRVPLRGGEPVDVAVIVDARHLVASAHYADLRTLARTQDVDHREIFVVCDADDGHEPPLATMFDEPRFSFRYARPGQPFGAVAAEIVEQGGFAAWTLWRPGQQWKPQGLTETARMLDVHLEASAVGAQAVQAPQAWADLESALWASRLDAAGIVFRTDRIAPDPTRDYGLNADAVVRLAIEGDGVIVEGDRFWARAYDASVFANRAGANSARKAHIPPIECTIPEGVRATAVVPTFEDWRMTLDAVTAVRADGDVGVIIVDNGSRRAVGAALREAFVADPYVQYVRLPVNTDFAVASDIGARIAQSETVVFLNNDTIVQDGWLDGLLAELPHAAAAQPLLLFADRTVQSAGTVFAGGLSSPRHLLTGFHRSDVPDAVGEYPFSAITAACMAVRRADYLDVGGFDAEYVNGMEDVDLCLRLKAATGRPLRVALAATVLHLESKTEGRFTYAAPNRARFAQTWREALLRDLDDTAVLDHTPLTVDEVRWSDQRGFALREPQWHIARRAPQATVTEAAPRLRWALKISSPGTALGDLWGDTYYAQDLAAALRRLGQDVVVDRTSSWDRPDSAGWDDVTLTLRGLSRFTPQPRAVNLLWVISHPDRVTVDELHAGWDAIYSAGPAWAEQQSARSGIPIQTLLQATDATRFRPTESDLARSGGVLFVGRTRGERRPVVLDAVDASVDLEVYGDDGWERYIDDRYIRGAVMRNDELPSAYGRARVVLNDHWSDMRRGGFLSNRLFDAAATGARIVSDDVPGLSDVFGDQVRTYGTLDELRLLLEPASTRWPSDDELAASAAQIATHHSFDARAKTLLADALVHRARQESARADRSHSSPR